jgi:hypothetical protein
MGIEEEAEKKGEKNSPTKHRSATVLARICLRKKKKNDSKVKEHTGSGSARRANSLHTTSGNTQRIIFRKSKHHVGADQNKVACGSRHCSADG